MTRVDTTPLPELARLLGGGASAAAGPSDRVDPAARSDDPSAQVEAPAPEHLLNTLVRSSSDLIAVIDDRAELLYANPATQRILGFVPAEEVNESIFDIVHPDDRDRAVEFFLSSLRQPGLGPLDVFRVETAAGEWRFLECVFTNCLDDPSVAGIVINARDITESENLFRALRTFGEANRVLVHATDEASLLLETCQAIVDAGGYDLAWVGYVEHDDASTVRPTAWSGKSDYLSEIHVSWADDGSGQGPIGTAVRTGHLQATEDLQEAILSPTDRAAAANHGFRTSCVLPLVVDRVVVGVLCIYAALPGAFGASEVQLLSDLGGALAYGIGRLRDGEMLRASELRFRTLARAAPVGILEISADGMVHYANPKIAEISSRDCGSLMGRGWIDAVHPEDAGGLLALVDRRRTRQERASITTRFRIQRPNGDVRHVQALAALERDDHDSGHVVIVEDITDELRAKEALTHQAFYDTLTGLPNRALFLERLNQELSRNNAGHPDIAVLFLDLDRLKIVNDSLGHETGDLLLAAVGERFTRAIREGDVAARFSGDEFIFLIRNVKDVNDAIDAAQRILGVLEEPVRHDTHDLIVTASIGIVIPVARADAATVLRDADTAMYQAKLSGGNRFALFDNDLHQRSVERLQMEHELRQALANREFEVYYQPIVRPGTGRPVGAEALIRWNHPSRGVVAPVEFIPVAEDLGLIKHIGRWVLEEALSQLAAWDAMEGGPRLDTIAINVSARQLDDVHIAEVVRHALDTHHIEARRVALEVTESIMMQDSDAVRRTLDSLKNLGVQIAIDDFGTGYSSLSYLHTLPVTAVKIDRSFIERLNGPVDSTSVVQAIIDMSHATGLDVVAEGVSDQSMQAHVSSMGCDAAQGYFWANPMNADGFHEWWSKTEDHADDFTARNPRDRRRSQRRR